MKYPCIVAGALSALLLLGACSALDNPVREQDPQMQKLVVGMEQCLSNQAQAAAQLQRQEQQLAQQQEQLEAVKGAIDRQGQEALTLGKQPVATADTCASPTATATATADKLTVGQLEKVWLQNLQLSLPARIDTGAETSSLDARNIELFERNGRRWVRFEIQHPDTGEPLPLERKLKRMVAILQSNSAEPERRAVIKMGITIGHISQTAEFTLSNRSHLDYQILVGRNVLRDVMLVDVSRKNIAPVSHVDEPRSEREADPGLPPIDPAIEAAP